MNTLRLGSNFFRDYLYLAEIHLTPKVQSNASPLYPFLSTDTVGKGFLHGTIAHAELQEQLHSMQTVKMAVKVLWTNMNIQNQQDKPTSSNEVGPSFKIKRVFWEPKMLDEPPQLCVCVCL